ncbi:hypothetical protein J2858_000372 [Neorhizobium galegae]|uniref:DUF4334 domain-containing protein n=1 Tax=Neorhizobium galegae TaxID=399 RepID=UPI001AE17C6F|nr:DUF4334 domain-containing protein [Neorhizobium galegae]MBP2547479.1 hypothetical protein [Neorhizobium galegae]
MSIPKDEDEAFALFDSLQPVEPGAIHGLWRGRGLATGHPLDGVLENLDWYGKRFHPDGRADALLFFWDDRRLIPVDPAGVPLRLGLRFARFGRRPIARNLFSYLIKALRARTTVAALRTQRFRGVASAAMAYDRQPIIDHFRKLDDDRLLGVMSIAGYTRHYFFWLDRVKGQEA